MPSIARSNITHRSEPGVCCRDGRARGPAQCRYTEFFPLYSVAHCGSWHGGHHHCRKLRHHALSAQRAQLSPSDGESGADQESRAARPGASTQKCGRAAENLAEPARGRGLCLENARGVVSDPGGWPGVALRRELQRRAPLFATDVLHLGATGFGFLSAATGVGSLLSALWLAWSNQKSAIRRVLIGMLVFGVLEVVFAVSRIYVLSLMLIAGVGFMENAFAAQALTTLQTVTPDHLRGRVTSVQVLFFDGILPLGYLLMGWLSGLCGAPSALLIGALLSADECGGYGDSATPPVPARPAHPLTAGSSPVDHYTAKAGPSALDPAARGPCRPAAPRY